MLSSIEKWIGGFVISTDSTLVDERRNLPTIFGRSLDYVPLSGTLLGMTERYEGSFGID